MDAPLDMRMDRTQSLTARDVVNRYDEAELSRILFQYGEERYARRIAAAIVRRRAEKEIGTTGELAELIRAAMPAPAMMTLIPLSSAPLAQVKKRSGSLCAEIMCIS